MTEALLRMQSITKEFPGVRALNEVDFDLYKGEVHCLVGENGAGKSTLIKIISGVYFKDKGKIFIGSKEVEISNPHQGMMSGISVIYQDPDLIPSLNVVENIFLGNEIYTKWKIINWKKMKIEAKKLLNSLNIDFSVNTLIRNLSVAQQQFVATARALSLRSQILIMDEPSTVLSGKELDLLFEVIRRLKRKGLGIIYISHRLSEIFEIGDRVTILRDGEKVKESRVEEINLDEIARYMVGREIKNYFFKKKISIGENILIVKNLKRREKLHNINFQLKKGEILGVFGLMGAGRTELARAIIGADPIDEGEIYLKGKKINIKSPFHALSLGISLIPEDRKRDGLLIFRSVEENISLTILREITRFNIINFRKLFELVIHFIRRLRIATPSLYQSVENLSGGNQQKVVIAKWLASRSKIFFMDEVTKGIDVGAKVEIYHLIYDLVKEGCSIVFISSELPEILSLCDRILVMCGGKITKELLPKKTTQEEILKFSLPI